MLTGQCGPCKARQDLKPGEQDWGGCRHEEEHRTITRRDLELAKDVLKWFDLVIIMERYEDPMLNTLLGNVLSMPGFKLGQVRTGNHKNVRNLPVGADEALRRKIREHPPLTVVEALK